MDDGQTFRRKELIMPMGWVAAAVVGSNIVGSVMGADAASQASSAYTNAANRGMAISQEALNEVKNQTAPYQTLGTNAASQYGKMIDSGYFTAQPTMDDLTKLMPNYQFGLSQGLGQFNAGLNAAGGMVSGNAIQGGQQFAQDYAGNQLMNAFNAYQANRSNVASNLGAGVGFGLNAANTYSSAASGTAASQANMLSSIGNAQAAGIMGQANAYQSGLNNISNYAMLYGLKKA